MPSFIYKHVALGGTFDLLHTGHKALIKTAFKKSAFVSIGITSAKMASALDKLTYEDEKTRKKNLLLYLKRQRLQKRYRLITLNDIFGSTLKDRTIEALVISGKTKKGADLINKKRASLKLKKLPTIVTKQINADDQKIVSSTRVRNGEISQAGQNYKNLLLKISGKRLSQSVRAKLKKPFGKIIKIDSALKKFDRLISVGDICTTNLLKNKIMPDISVVDFFVNRKRSFYNLTQLGFASANPDVIIKNEAGQISKILIESIENALRENNKAVILVDGEEDLAAIPAILLSPLGTALIYGQPQKGAVLTEIEPQTKESLCALLEV